MAINTPMSETTSLSHHSLGRVSTTDKVVDNVGVTNALLNRLGVP